MRRPELPGLTGIRFYAAVFVYLSHVVELIPGMATLGGSFLLFNAGVVSVSFFFTLSGFILTYNYSESFKENISLNTYKQFIWNRLAKIYPVHLLGLLIVLPLAVLSPNLPLDWRAVPLHTFLIQSWWPSSDPTFTKYLNVPSWSLSCELLFYLLAPLVMFCAWGKDRAWVSILAALGYMGGLGFFLWEGQSDLSRFYFVYNFAPSRLLEFMAGVYLARGLMAVSTQTIARFSGPAQVVGVLLILAGALYREQASWPLWGGLLYIPGSALLIIGLAYGRGFIVEHLSRPWLHWLGTASFSLYIIHAPLLRWVKGACGYLGWSVSSWPLFWGVTVSLFLVVQLVALGVLLIFELPLQRRLRTIQVGALKEPQEPTRYGTTSG